MESLSDFKKIELPIYSIMKFTELEILSQNEAKLDLMVGSVIIWESNQMEASLFPLTETLKISEKSLFKERKDLFFDAEKVQELFELQKCSTCASLILFILRESHKHCEIKVFKI